MSIHVMFTMACYMSISYNQYQYHILNILSTTYQENDAFVCSHVNVSSLFVTRGSGVDTFGKLLSSIKLTKFAGLFCYLLEVCVNASKNQVEFSLTGLHMTKLLNKVGYLLI